MNDEDGGGVFPAGLIDVHLHGIAPQKSPGAPMCPDGNDEWNGSAMVVRRGSLRCRSRRGSAWVQSADDRLLATARNRG